MLKNDNHHFVIAENQTGIRIDKFLAEQMPDISRTRIKNLILDYHVTRDDEPIIDPSAKTRLGQEFEINIPPAQSTAIEPENIPLDIIYEDHDIIVINKQAGLVVHPAPGNYTGTLVNALLYHCGDQLSGIGGVKRPGIVHRLDKETTGVMVAAKNDKAHHALSEQFAAHTITREYIALVWGHPPTSGTIETLVGRHQTNRKKMAVVRQGGKNAITHYKTLEKIGDFAARVLCKLETGRTHQIRIHLTHIGHSLIGDQTYGRARNDKNTPDLFKNFPRQALHAHKLGLIHPGTGQYQEWQTPVPADMQSLLNPA